MRPCRRVRRYAVPPGHPEAGLTLLETTVALGVISTVMAALTSFFLVTTNTSRVQQEVEVATKLATDAMSRARSLRGSALVNGRDAAGSHLQWANRPAAVQPYLSDTVEAFDPGATPGSPAALPTTGSHEIVDDVRYEQQWYLRRCWQPAGGGACSATVNSVRLVRVVVSISWRDKNCAADTCWYVTSTLISDAAADPLFNANR